MHLTSLPNDIIYEILRQLPIQDMLMVGRLNHHFNKICDNPNFWRRLITEFDPAIKVPKRNYLRHLHFAGPIVLHKGYKTGSYRHKILSENYIPKCDLFLFVGSILDSYPSYTAHYMRLKLGVKNYKFCTILRQTFGPNRNTRLGPEEQPLMDLLGKIHQIDIIKTEGIVPGADREMEYIDKSSQNLPIFKNYVGQRQNKIYNKVIKKRRTAISSVFSASEISED